MINKILKLSLKKLRDFLINDFREKILSEIIVKIILKYSNNKETIKIIDYGAGFEAKIAFCVYDILKKKYKINVKIYCYDLYSLDNLKILNQNKNIIFFNIKDLNFDNIKYDFCLISDVLHHIGVNKTSELKNLINNLQNKTEYILIKDHFIYGFFSHMTLITMEFLGNYFKKNVNVATRFFDKSSFNYLLKLTNSEIVEEILNIQCYQSYFLFMSNPKLHFIYLIKKFK